MINHPRLLCLVCLCAMYLMAWIGGAVRTRLNAESAGDAESLALVVSASLTLLGLIIGFTFSMATNRYDQRRLYEEQEANAIGTEYLRADLLPAAEAAQVKQLLRAYTASRIRFYEADYGTRLSGVDRSSEQLQGALWTAVKPAASSPTPVMALVLSGMNDVINSQGYTQFAWWNRIPTTAWVLMILIAMAANGLVGYATRRSRAGRLLLLVLPLLVSISFFLIADIDSPRGGIIRIPPRDLVAVQKTLPPQP